MTLTITCESCGTVVEAARPTKRFCSSACRSRARHATPAPADELEDTDLVRAVRRELEMSKRLDSFDGQLAILLAQRIGTAPNASVAAFSVELRAAMARAVVGVGVEDEVAKARRAAREKREAAGLDPKR